MQLAIVVAQSKNRVIGVNNDLPWRLPKDLAYFKSVTLGKPIIMGRKTFESIGRPLPGRTNIVISRNAQFAPEGVEVVASLLQAVELAKEVCARDSVDEAMIIGGAQIYAQAIEMADSLYITQVDAHIEGDAFFPEVDYSAYRLEFQEDWQSDDKNPYAYSFLRFAKAAADQ